MLSWRGNAGSSRRVASDGQERHWTVGTLLMQPTIPRLNADLSPKHLSIWSQRHSSSLREPHSLGSSPTYVHRTRWMCVHRVTLKLLPSAFVKMATLSRLLVTVLSFLPQALHAISLNVNEPGMPNFWTYFS